MGHVAFGIAWIVLISIYLVDGVALQWGNDFRLDWRLWRIDGGSSIHSSISSTPISHPQKMVDDAAADLNLD